jgi:hypothetical protein
MSNRVQGDLHVGKDVRARGIDLDGPSVINVNSSSDALRVTQVGSGNALVVEDSANPDATPFVIDSDGKVSIGSTTDGAVINTSGAVVVSRETGTSVFTGKLASTTVGASPNIVIQRSRGTNQTPVAVNSGDQLVRIRVGGYDGSGFINAAEIQAAVDGTPGTNDMPGRLAFLTTASGSSTPTERMRINNAGLITGSGTSLGAWTAYTPTLGGTGWALGNGTATGAYCQIGKVVHFRATITFGSTSTFGASANPTATLPISAVAATTDAILLRATVQDVSTGLFYVGFVRFDSTSVLSVRQMTANTNGQASQMNATTPITFDNGDIIHISGSYEVA